jgi:hypothetical protein
MILKKYRIGPVGILNILYKRIELQNTNATQDDICALCGVGQERCKSVIICSPTVDRLLDKHLTYHDLCYGLEIMISSDKLKTKSNIAYIPWKIR